MSLKPLRPGRRDLLQAALAAPLAVGAAGRVEAATPLVLATDPLRPRFHFLPPSGWMNDPNGPLAWQGRSHLFYQYNPGAAVWAAPHWGHAVSADLVHWQHLPIALSPTPGGTDADVVFSGSALVAEGKVHLMYTGVRATSLEAATIKDSHPPLVETQCIATADDASLIHWTKRPAPVIAAPPEGFRVNGFRDPSPWRQGDTWYAVIGSGIAGRGGAILLYRSHDLLSWEFVRVFVQASSGAGSAPNPWDVWECPEFFPLGDRHVLIFSTSGKGYWQSGKLDPATMTFHAERGGILDYGNFYAPKTQLDAQGRRILWGWIQEARAEAEHKAAGWAGMMSLPRILTLDGQGGLVQTFIPALESLRKGALPVGPTTRLPACRGELEIRSAHLRADVSLELADATTGETWLPIAYRADQPDVIWIDGRPLEAFSGQDRSLRLQIYIDGSVAELSINGRAMWTRRFYYAGPQRDALVRIATSARDMLDLRAWKMADAIPTSSIP